MAGPEWGIDGPEVIWTDVANTPYNGRCDLVAQIACWDEETNDCLVVLYPCNTSARLTGVRNILPETVSITVFDAKCIRDDRTLAFEVDEQSCVAQQSVFQWSHFSTMLELCSGLGVATYGFEEAGILTTMACDASQPFAEAFQMLHEDSRVLVGDITNRETMKLICTSSEQVGVMFAGFPCQPYSRGGSMGGATDSRSNPLIHILMIAMYCRIPVVALECVPDAATNKFVRRTIKSFCSRCRYHMTETVLKQEHVWPCRRERWWAILTTSTIGPIPVKPLPIYRFPEKIRQIFPAELDLPQDELEQLRLQDEEQQRFLQFAKDLQSMALQKNGVCPTVLHSLGSQVTACRCGCRNSGFSDASLNSRGIYGFLIPECTKKDGCCTFRHPHPSEIAILTACPIVQWPKDMRLTLAGLGQQANPIHALWIGSQIRCRLAEIVKGSPQEIQPRKILDLYLEKMLKQAKQMIPVVNTDPDVVGDEIPCVDHQATCLSSLSNRVHSLGLHECRHVGGPESCSVFTLDSNIPAIVALSNPFLTVGHLRAAEVGSLPTCGVFDVIDGITSEPLHNSSLLTGRSVIIKPIDLELGSSDDVSPENLYGEPMEVDTAQEELSPTVPFSVHVELLADMDEDAQMTHPSSKPEEIHRTQGCEPLASLKASELARMIPPVVSNLQVLNGLMASTMSTDHRKAVLQAQDDLWADDEIRWHLNRILEKSEDPTKILLDPLLATHVMTSGQTGLIFRWVQQLKTKVKMIVTAVWTHGHWTPYAWTWNEQCLIAHSWDVQGTSINCNLLHDALAKAVGARTFMGHTAHRQFADHKLCGVCAVRWLDHFVSGKMLPSDLSEAEHLHQVAKQIFMEFLQHATAVARPWIWASGLDALVNARLLDLLQQHGVPKSEVDQRAKVVVNAIGVSAVQKAVTGTAPWRSIKALANQAEPVVQLVMPDELAEVVKQRADSGGDKMGKQKKKADKSKVNLTTPVQLDPAKVQIATGVFVDESPSNHCGRPRTFDIWSCLSHV